MFWGKDLMLKKIPECESDGGRRGRPLQCNSPKSCILWTSRTFSRGCSMFEGEKDGKL